MSATATRAPGTAASLAGCAPVVPQLCFEGISLSFGGVRGRAPMQILREINLAIGEGEFICIIGPSGCGKSTLLSLLAGYVTPSAGRILAQGRVVSGPGPDRVMAFQAPSLFPWLTAAQNVAYGLRLAAHRRKVPDWRARVDELLSLVGLAGFAQHYPSELSGGMRQRVEIARALAVDPAILLMDEPFGALDALTRRSMQGELIRIWRETRKTILFVTHDIDEALVMADRIVVMSPRPATVADIMPVALARPRHRDDPVLRGLAGRIAASLGVEE